ncbi:oxidoreductase [Naematelia encephala]|uniref:Oxidoreductase n=1 Tax=Naematelia encephala TaxID=71784 RepID=A0A1Y2B9C1_9TREE|nr:oxidoreductase [Naematelia encephala]
MSKPIRVSVLGAGMSLSVLHVPSILALPDKFVVHSVLERTDTGRARKACGEGIKVVPDLEGVISDPEVDLVVIATPNTSHYSYSKAALEAGKHVLIEKPITPTAEEAEELVALAKSKGLILSVYQNRRWDSDFLTVKELLTSQKLGELIEFKSQYDRYRPLPPDSPRRGWKETPGEGNDVIYNLGSHIIDQAFVLFGKPQKVFARTWDIRGIGLDESFEMDLYYPPSVKSSTAPLVVRLSASILSRQIKQLRFALHGTKGSYTKYGVDPQESFLKKLAAGEPKGEGYGSEPPELWGQLVEDVAGGDKGKIEGEKVTGQDGVEFVVSKYKSQAGDYPALYENLYEAISSGDSKKLAVKPEEAIEVIRIIQLGLKSAKEGKVLDVSW